MKGMSVPSILIAFLLVMSFDLFARVLTGVGESENPRAARSIALRNISEQISVSVDSSTTSVLGVVDGQYQQTMDETINSVTRNQLSGVVFEESENDGVYTVTATFDVKRAIDLIISSKDGVKRQLKLLNLQDGPLSTENLALVANAYLDVFESAEQLALLHSLAGIPFNLANYTAAFLPFDINDIQLKLDNSTRLTFTSDRFLRENAYRHVAQQVSDNVINAASASAVTQFDSDGQKNVTSTLLTRLILADLGQGSSSFSTAAQDKTTTEFTGVFYPRRLIPKIRKEMRLVEKEIALISADQALDLLSKHVQIDAKYTHHQALAKIEKVLAHKGLGRTSYKPSSEVVDIVSESRQWLSEKQEDEFSPDELGRYLAGKMSYFSDIKLCRPLPNVNISLSGFEQTRQTFSKVHPVSNQPQYFIRMYIKDEIDVDIEVVDASESIIDSLTLRSNAIQASDGQSDIDKATWLYKIRDISDEKIVALDDIERLVLQNIDELGDAKNVDQCLPSIGHNESASSYTAASHYMQIDVSYKVGSFKLHPSPIVHEYSHAVISTQVYSAETKSIVSNEYEHKLSPFVDRVSAFKKSIGLASEKVTIEHFQ